MDNWSRQVSIYTAFGVQLPKEGWRYGGQHVRHAARAAITPSPAIFVTERARELVQTAFESSSKVITKVHRSTFCPRSPFDLQRSRKDDPGHSPSEAWKRLQWRLLSVVQPKMIVLVGNKVCQVDFHVSKIKNLKMLRIILFFTNFDFEFWIWSLCIRWSKICIAFTVTDIARELGQTAFESSSKVIKKVH